MNSEEEDDIVQPEKLPIYEKGKEIFDMVNKIAALIPENDEYLNEIKACMLFDAALLTVKVAGAEAAGVSAHSTKTPMMTSHFVVLTRIPNNERILSFSPRLRPPKFRFPERRRAFHFGGLRRAMPDK
jgi:hypothetical protein